MATAVAPLVARGGCPRCVWSRNSAQAGWVVEDVHDDAPQAQGHVTIAASIREAIETSDVVVPALPWGPALGQVLTPVLDLLPGKVVVDVCNPYEMTALGPKMAMSVPGGSAAAQLTKLLPETTAHLHCFTQVRADRLNVPQPGDDIVLPFVMDHGDAAPGTVHAFLALITTTGWLPHTIGGMEQAAVVEEGGPWAAASGAAGQGLLSIDEAHHKGLLR
jgi:predicted dinucleotide-binding enzyme